MWFIEKMLYDGPPCMEIREKARKIYEIRGRCRKMLEKYTEIRSSYRDIYIRYKKISGRYREIEGCRRVVDIDPKEMQKDLWGNQDRRYKEM
jgi:hypothetical protein